MAMQILPNIGGIARRKCFEPLGLTNQMTQNLSQFEQPAVSFIWQRTVLLVE